MNIQPILKKTLQIYQVEPVEEKNRIQMEKTQISDIIYDKSQENVERLKIFAESTSDGIILLDGEILTDVNSTMLGLLEYSREECIGKKILDFIPEKFHFQVISLIKNNSNNHLEIEGISRDGKIIPLEINCKNQVHNEKVVKIISIRDISRHLEIRKNLEHAKKNADQANLLKDHLITMTAHDFRSPLCALLGYLDILDSNIKTNSNKMNSEIISRINKISLGMCENISEILNIERIESGNLKINKFDINLREILDTVIEIIDFSASRKGVKIINKTPTEFICNVDRILFQAVIQNLISNAVKFCNSGDEIIISISGEHKNILQIQDTGVGVDDGLLPIILSNQDNISHIGTAGEKGTGLGLSYCRKIIELHGGLLYVKSKKGEGSTFFVELPV